MKKKIISFLIAFLLILPTSFLLVACGKDKDKDKDSNNNDNSTTVTTPSNKEIYEHNTRHR